jgi:hypothetical protein
MKGFKNSFGAMPDDPTDLDNFGFNLIFVAVLFVLCIIFACL